MSADVFHRNVCGRCALCHKWVTTQVKASTPGVDRTFFIWLCGRCIKSLDKQR